ncbi:MAG: TAXI family TRAP transporter solute-binding subunit [candidate division WOR-3 bacterium]
MRRLIVVVMILTLVVFATSRPVSAAERPKTKIRLLTTAMGTGAYFLAFKLAEIVNKKSTWLQLEPVEAGGSAANIQMVMRDPSIKKTTIINSTNLSTDFARRALPPFTKSYKEVMGTDLQVAFGQYNMLCPFITTDPKMRTINDLAGKKAVLASKGMAAGYVNQYILEKHGLWSKIKPQYMDYAPSANALRDGLVDAVVAMVTLSKSGEYSVIGAFTELLATKDVYLVHGGDASIMEQVGKEKGIEVVPVHMSGKFDNRPIPTPMTTFYQGVAWVVDETVDEAVVYEVTKLLYENIDEIRAVHPSMNVMTRAVLANVSSEANFHRGARKFFKEAGVKIGFHGL